MRLALSSIVLAALLAGCASLTAGPPGCDGRTKRPANPNGSVLSAGVLDVGGPRAVGLGCR